MLARTQGHRGAAACFDGGRAQPVQSCHPRRRRADSAFKGHSDTAQQRALRRPTASAVVTQSTPTSAAPSQPGGQTWIVSRRTRRRQRNAANLLCRLRRCSGRSERSLQQCKERAQSQLASHQADFWARFRDEVEGGAAAVLDIGGAALEGTASMTVSSARYFADISPIASAGVACDASEADVEWVMLCCSRLLRTCPSHSAPGCCLCKPEATGSAKCIALAFGWFCQSSK